MRFLKRRHLHIGMAAVAVVAVGAIGAAPASAADPAAASAYGAQILVGGQVVIPPTPAASVATAPGDDSKTTIDIPASPVAVNGTLIATANAHTTADIASGLTVVTQSLAGPYAARGIGTIEDVGVVYDVAGEGIPLVSAAAIRAEAVAVCTPTPQYAANSEIIDLAIGGTDVPLNAPVQDLIDGITDALGQSGLNAVVDVQRNVVTNLEGGGVAIDGLVVTILAAAGETPLAQVHLAHAEVTSSACKHLPQCSDTVDNDADAVIDTADPGCHSDGDAANPATYVPSDDDERNSAALGASGPDALPRTGGGAGALAAVSAGALAASVLGLGMRRKYGIWSRATS
jgi:hypothetical protein